MAQTRRRGPGRAIALVVAIVVVALGVYVLMQLGRWTCQPPDGVWVEGPDHCVELP